MASTVNFIEALMKEADASSGYRTGSGMRRLKWLLFGALAAIVVGFATVLDDDDYLHIPAMLKGPSDHYLHLAAFLALSCVALLGERRWGAIVICLMLLAAGLEFAQIYIPSRNANFGDLGFSLLGVCAGSAFALLLNRLMPYSRQIGNDYTGQKNEWR
jgi:peptidoglycan/LPS O-acetylase OafA/YrhL